MTPATKTKVAYAALVLLVQIYVVYAATLYVEVGTAGFLCVLCAAAVSAAGSGLYLFVLANEDLAGRVAPLTPEERRRIG